MTNNHPELVGVQTTLQDLLYKLNMAMREGTLHAVADRLSDIEHQARTAGFKVNEIMFRNRPLPKILSEVK